MEIDETLYAFSNYILHPYVIEHNYIFKHRKVIFVRTVIYIEIVTYFWMPFWTLSRNGLQTLVNLWSWIFCILLTIKWLTRVMLSSSIFHNYCAFDLYKAGKIINKFRKNPKSIKIKTNWPRSDSGSPELAIFRMSQLPVSRGNSMLG